MLGGLDTPRNLDRPLAHTPGQRNRRERADRSGKQPENAVLQEQHPPDGAGVRPQRLEHRRLVNALELGHGDGANQNQHAAEQHQAAHHGDGEGDLGHHAADRLQHLAQIDHRDVRKALHQIVLEPRASRGIVGPFERRDHHLRSGVENAGPEHEHEPAASGVAPVDLSDAGDPRRHDTAQDVEPHRIADGDSRSLADALLDRHLCFGRRSGPELAVDDPLVRFQMVAIGNGELAAEPPALPHVFQILEVGLLAVDAGHAGAKHRDQLELTGAALPVGQEFAHPRHLVALDVHEEHVGPGRARAHVQFFEQARLHRADTDDEEGAEADRQQDDPRLVPWT